MEIEHCGFAYHTKGYHATHHQGLGSYLLRLQTEGTCHAVVNDQNMKIEKGDLLLVSPWEYYQLTIDNGQASGDFHLLFRGDWMDKWWNRSRKPSVTRIGSDDSILSLWRFLIAEKRRPATDMNHELMEHLLRSLCLYIERTIEDRSSTIRPFVVTNMMRFIEEHATTGFVVQHVANHVDLSVSRTVHLFKEYVGKTIMEYAQEIRLSAAIDQMKYTNMTLEHIAENCGFGTYPYFHRVFKKSYGVSPGSYRKMD